MDRLYYGIAYTTHTYQETHMESKIIATHTPGVYIQAWNNGATLFVHGFKDINYSVQEIAEKYKLSQENRTKLQKQLLSSF